MHWLGMVRTHSHPVTLRNSPLWLARKQEGMRASSHACTSTPANECMHIQANSAGLGTPESDQSGLWKPAGPLVFELPLAQPGVSEHLRRQRATDSLLFASRMQGLPKLLQGGMLPVQTPSPPLRKLLGYNCGLGTAVAMCLGGSTSSQSTLSAYLQIWTRMWCTYACLFPFAAGMLLSKFL